MGKGDKKTRKGKIAMGSYGVKRKRDKSVITPTPKAAKEKAGKTKVAVVAEAAPEVKKTAPKKAAATKPAAAKAKPAEKKEPAAKKTPAVKKAAPKKPKE